LPDLFYVECANVLLKYTRRYKRPIEDSLADLEDLNKLALKLTSITDLIEDALLLANEKDLTAYDTCHAVLAQKLKPPLITADAPLAKAVDRGF
jgi:predicted nucleic acid-binding protein